MNKRTYTPKDKYNDHKGNAKKRNIPFLLTFEEWWDIWQQSGHWDDRGGGTRQYVMSRHGPDIGPYAIGNVFIQTKGENTLEAMPDPGIKRRNKKATDEQKVNYSKSAQSREQIICPKCQKSCKGPGAFKRHSDACQKKRH